MAEPFIPYGPDLAPKLDLRSELLKAKEKYAGLPVIACPFGCKEKDLDEQEYCKHTAGFTDPNEPGLFYPMKPRPDPRGGPSRFRFVDGADPQVVEDTDVLVEISAAAGARVYRKAPSLAKVS